ncbi:hypothetical protein L227DRAFT_278841 [Lentinus tigrinus ALCF2SS1-6]|uniref:F-box domain-containing protein n=1 Tax=Lentinus tigrinus ALCF2SS1-6 TaxID=1328759 RepID=A0A5C2SPR1_9APHY|nr:hypothetical protein L227DRAFT_278841 [Lentinus tigrinus ALCF2SS1-6]
MSQPPPARCHVSVDSTPATASASRRLVETYDILWRIFSGPRTRGSQSPYLLSPADLARCTRVCHAFHDPAVRVLWSTLDGFIPLWQLLAPLDLPFQAKYNEECFRIVVDAQLWNDSKCWDRFLNHAHYVLTLRVAISHMDASPHLATFTLQVLDDAGHWLVDEMVQLQSLRKINFSPTLSLEDVHALLTMPNLASLNARVSGECETDVFMTASNLHVLELHGSSPDISRLFATLNLPSLESLELNIFDTTPCGPGLPICTAAIARAFISSTLRRLHLTFNATFDYNQLPPSDPSVSLSALLQPLLHQTPNLEIFTLRFDGPLKLWATDDVFEEMAQSWPSLQTLRLDFRAWHDSGPMPTPAVLARFARSCPRLQDLVLPYLNYRIDVDPALYRELHGHALRRLFIADDRSMGTAGPDRVLALAEMVNNLFPHLDLSFRSYIKNPGMPWWKVFDCLRVSPTRPSARGLLHAASHSYLP